MSESIWTEGSWNSDMEPIIPDRIPRYVFGCVYQHGKPVIQPLLGADLLEWLCEKGREEDSHGRPLPRWAWWEILSPMAPF